MNSLAANIAIFAIAAIAIALAGTRMTAVADRLADKTGLGEALVGALFLGGSTSLPGIVASVTAAITDHPELAASNALGGIAAQTAFLAIADIVYRKANLEHAAASIANLMQGSLLIALLSMSLLAMASPEVSLLAINPMTLFLIGVYLFGLRLTSQAQNAPMWVPRRTTETLLDEPDEPATSGGGAMGLWGRFGVLAIIVGVSGYAVAQSGVAIAAKTGLSETIVGTLFTAVSTSLPELVTTVAAVRTGALTLAVSGVFGGNSFDILLLAFSDLAYRGGSIYHIFGDRQVFIATLTIFMTAIMLLGLLRREKYGIGNIGFESFFILLLYAGGICILMFG
jgi:cation:H+ antiporter